MPAEFLSDEQRVAYGAFGEVPSLSDLERFFFLDAFDRNVIARSRQDAHRLGAVVDYLAEQLGIGDPSQVKRYGERPKAGYEHAWMIRDAYGYRMLDDRESWESRVPANR